MDVLEFIKSRRSTRKYMEGNGTRMTVNIQK